MSLLSRVAAELSGKNQKKNMYESTINSVSHNCQQPKQIAWQCKFCGRKTYTYGDSPKSGICDARGKVNGRTKPHEWRRG